MIKIIAEASVPFLRGVAEQYADIEYIDNKDILRCTQYSMD